MRARKNSSTGLREPGCPHELVEHLPALFLACFGIALLEGLEVTLVRLRLTIGGCIGCVYASHLHWISARLLMR